MKYCQAILPVAGLGNKLFPWARCKVFSYKYGVPMLSPVWAQLKIGHFLRQESDLRLSMDLFCSTKEDVSGIRKAMALVSTKKRLDEENDFEKYIKSRDGDSCIFQFSEYRQYFETLQGSREMLYKAILSMTRLKWREVAQRHKPPPISIHVRRGDFAQPSHPKEMLTKGGVRSPIEWFCLALEKIRKVAGFDTHAQIFSDGRQEELAALLKMPNTEFVRTGSAISDLLAMSQCKVLIGSGGSSFSAWASFLGEAQTISHPGQSLTWFKLRSTDRQFVGEFDIEGENAIFLNKVKKSFDGAA